MVHKIRCNECEMFIENCTCHADREKAFEELRVEWVKLGKLTLEQATPPDWSRYQWLTKQILERMRSK